MTARRVALFVSILAGGACLCLAEGTSAAKLLDGVIAQPGHWNQMCSMPAPLPPEVPLPLYSLAAERNFNVSDASIEKLGRDRAEVVKELRSRLKFADLNRAAHGRSHGIGAESGQDPRQFSGLMLSIIQKLDAIETVPELLNIEASLDLALAASRPDSRKVFPGLDLDSPVAWSLERNTNGPKVSVQVFTARVLQRETLAIIASLLRSQKYTPLLESKMERHYLEHLREAATKPPLQDIKTPADIPENMREWVTFDPVHNLPCVKTRGYESMPYSPALRLQIRGWAEDYLKAHPELAR